MTQNSCGYGIVILKGRRNIYTWSPIAFNLSKGLFPYKRTKGRGFMLLLVDSKCGQADERYGFILLSVES